LGVDEIALVKQNLGWEHEPFHVPAEVYDFFTTALDDRRQEASEWERGLEMRLASDSGLAAQWHQHFSPAPLVITTPEYEAGSKVATRAISGAVINEFAAARPDVIGGSADLASSNNTLIKSSANFSKDDRSGRNLRYGVREHAMGAVTNGITVHGGMRGYGATFLTFVDYMRGAVRIGALMGAPSVWVLTHDSIFLGEDGPTHQSVEHVASLRTIPNLYVIRPATAAEVAGAWELALNRDKGPTALILTRQGLPVGDPRPVPVSQGGYVVRDGDDAVIVATGSELPTAIEAAESLAADGNSIRVVSMPCVEAFVAQDDGYKSSVLGEGLPIASLEAGVTFGWGDIVGKDGLSIGIDRFGASAPAGDLAEHFGFTSEKVADKLRAWLS
jgi:transketolase